MTKSGRSTTFPRHDVPYRVEVTDRAGTEAEEAYLWILERAPEAAARWWNGLEEAILSLEEMPTRCHLAPENDEFEEEIRELLYGKRRHRYRNLFTIREEAVIVLHIRHGAREHLQGEDIETGGQGG